MSNMGDMGVPDLKALVAFGKVGINMLASRMLSLGALLGVVALCGFVAYSPSWEGAAVTGILAIFVFIPSLRAESGKSQESKNDTQA